MNEQQKGNVFYCFCNYFTFSRKISPIEEKKTLALEDNSSLFLDISKSAAALQSITIPITQHKPHIQNRIKYIHFDHLKMSKSQNGHEFSFIISLWWSINQDNTVNPGAKTKDQKTYGKSFLENIFS